ncbi:MAG: AraC family transcriptional regulator [Bacteroidales bacterium]|nr:AraC family transcriptional regulator [Bacteroidales bacterium]
MSKAAVIICTLALADSTAARLGASSRRETGKTPKEFIHQFLIGQIKNALLTTEMTHQQIADQFGFPDQSAFGQFFKRQEGMSPSEFRKRYR